MVVTEPLEPPLQDTLVTLLADVIAGGLARVMLLTAEHPLASVTVTVYVPGESPVTD
jgi:hypothetical protein